MALIFSLLVLLALAAPVFGLHYLTRLPEAPACPTCRRVTTGSADLGAERLLAVLSATQVRSCTACGWRGRMRWRWALEKEGTGEG